jgi:chromosome segregation ATPase
MTGVEERKSTQRQMMGADEGHDWPPERALACACGWTGEAHEGYDDDGARMVGRMGGAQAHNSKLKETAAALDVELKEKMATIAKYEVEIKRRTDEIEKKTKEVDRYNRQYEKMMSAMEGPENLGPLEATIAHINKELETKATEGKEMQRRWVGFQVELVALVAENNTLSEAVQVSV